MKNSFLKRSSILFLSFLCFLPIYSQKEFMDDFAGFAKYSNEKFGIEYKMPASFIDINNRTVFAFSYPGTGFIYSPILKSEDGNCVILYEKASILYSLISCNDDSKNFMLCELNVALKKGQNGATVTPADIKKHITILGVDKPENVDSVYILRVPNSQSGDSILNKRIPGKEKPGTLTYPYCTGIYIVKEGYTRIFYKLFFTKKGKKNEAQYLKTFFSSMTFPKEAKIIPKNEVGIRAREVVRSIKIRHK